MKKYIIFALSALLMSCYGYGSVAIQQGVDNEITEKIQESKASQLYGDWLFNGGFKETTFSAVNPHYQISQGDNLLVQLWGGIDLQAELKVDPQGNIFIPKVGPIKVVGVSNAELNKVILKSIKRVYKSNVEAYVSLLSSQTVKVFLSGLVNKPGLYEGHSADSILRFIDLAGGIRRDIGSLRHIEVKRANKSKYQVDLYNFIQRGEMPAIQLQDGDVIFVGAKQGEITIEGDVGFQGKYELNDTHSSLKEVLKAVVTSENATHVTVIAPQRTDTSNEINVQQYDIDSLLLGKTTVEVNPGSLIKISSQLRAKSISIELIGEHDSEFEVVLPWGASLADLLSQVKYTKLSNENAIQLFRKSVAHRQKDMLQASLSALEQSVLTARSETNEAAQLRATEAKSILAWIDNARTVEPKGQVLLTDDYDPSQVTLQQGDRVVVPAKKSLVMIHGEVLFPTAIAYNNKMNALEFIEKAGGVNDEVADMNILVMKPNGDFIAINEELDSVDQINPGDEIFVLAKPDVKSFQFTKDITQVIYQIAVSAAVVLAL